MKKMDNKGFSLVELIIVIAIMAILVAIIGSQVIPYIEKSRVSKDLSTLDTIYSSAQTIIADASTIAPLTGFTAVAYSGFGDAVATAGGGTARTWQVEFEELTGIPAASANSKMASKKAKANGGTIQIAYTAGTNPDITVSCGNLSVSSTNGSTVGN